MFSAAQFRAMYAGFASSLSRKVTLRVQNGSGFDDYPDVRAFVRDLTQEDLVAGSGLQLSDIRLIVLDADMPDAIKRLTKKDRVVIDGTNHSVVRWASQTRRVGEERIAFELVVRA